MSNKQRIKKMRDKPYTCSGRGHFKRTLRVVGVHTLGVFAKKTGLSLKVNLLKLK